MDQPDFDCLFWRCNDFTERQPLHHGNRPFCFWIGAIVMLFSHLAGKNGLKAVMGKEMQLPDFVWTRLTYA